PVGALAKRNLESEGPGAVGTSLVDQFNWKQVLDMFSCTECGRCSSNCPAAATGKPLAPRQLLLDLRDYLYAHQDEVIAKRVGAAPAYGVGCAPSGVGAYVSGHWMSERVESV